MPISGRIRCPAFGMSICGLMPRGNIALAAEPSVLHSVTRQALITSRAQLEPLTRILAAALAPCFVNMAAHRLAFSHPPTCCRDPHRLPLCASPRARDRRSPSRGRHLLGSA
jgi:hypothetical protein